MTKYYDENKFELQILIGINYYIVNYFFYLPNYQDIYLLPATYTPNT